MSIKKELRDYEVYFDLTDDAVYIETGSSSDDLDLETFKKMVIKELENDSDIEITNEFAPNHSLHGYIDDLNEIRDFRVFFDGFTEDADCDYLLFVDGDQRIYRDTTSHWSYYHSDDFLIHSVITIKDGYDQTIIKYNGDIIEIIQDDFNVTDDLDTIEKIISTVENNENELKINDITFQLTESGGVDCYGRIDDLETVQCDDDFDAIDSGVLGVITESAYGSSVIVYVNQKNLKKAV